FRVGDERAFNLRGAEPMSGDIDHVVDPAGQPIEPVLIPASAVPGKIEPRKGRKIGLHEASMIAEHRAHHSRPRAGEAKVAFAWTVDMLAVIVDDDGLDAKERPRRGARLQRRSARDRSDQNSAGFGLPPGINDRAALIADMIVVP